MSPLKFSSAAGRSIEGVFLSTPGYQSFPNVRRRKPSLDFLSNGCGLFLAPVKVGGDFGPVPQVVRDHGVHVRQGNGGVLLGNLLGSCTSVGPAQNLGGLSRRLRRGSPTRITFEAVFWSAAAPFASCTHAG
jgi:hypothetical protein